MNFRIASALVFVLGLSSCAVVPETGRRQLMLVPPEEETRMGLEAFTDIKQKEKISNDAAQTARIRRIGERIAKSVGRELPNAQWEFVVFESDQINAFALPGGKVGVYTGLIKLAGSDDELAAVMGHEIAHVTSRHGGERASQNMAAEGIGTLAATYMAAKNVDPQKQSLILGLYGAGATGAVILPFSRAHESEADAIGLRFAAGAGYDPRAAITFWQKMAKKSGGNEPLKWFSTHPPTSERIANLEKLAPQYLPLYENAKTQY